MARYDVFRLNGPTEGFVVNVQDQSLDFLQTRVIVSLLPEGEYPPVRDLNPIGEFDGCRWVLMAQDPAVIPKSRLRYPVGQLSDHRDEIVRAFDRLLTGV